MAATETTNQWVGLWKTGLRRLFWTVVMQHGVQLVAQCDQLGKRHVGAPPAPKHFHHFWKPASLRVTGGHFGSILSSLSLRYSCVYSIALP